MKNINIKKRKSPLWPWFALVATVLLVIFIRPNKFSDYKKDQTPVGKDWSDTIDQADKGSSMAIQADQKIINFVAFVNNHITGETTNIGHENTSTGIKHLADAVVAIANEKVAKDTTAINQAQDLNNLAFEIQKSFTSTKNIDKIKLAFSSATEILETVQKEHYPELNEQVDKLWNVIKSMNNTGLTINQTTSVKDFFSQSSKILEYMKIQG